MLCNWFLAMYLQVLFSMVQLYQQSLDVPVFFVLFFLFSFFFNRNVLPLFYVC